MQTIHPIWPAMPRHLRGHPWLQVSAGASGPSCHHRVPCPRFYYWYPIDYSPSPLYCYLFRRSVSRVRCALLTAHCTAQPREISRLTPISFHCTYCTKTVNAWAIVFLPMLPTLPRWVCFAYLEEFGFKPHQDCRGEITNSNIYIHLLTSFIDCQRKTDTTFFIVYF